MVIFVSVGVEGPLGQLEWRREEPQKQFGRRWVRAASPRVLVLEGVSIFLSGVDPEGPRGGPMSSRSELVGQWLEQK